MFWKGFSSSSLTISNSLTSFADPAIQLLAETVALIQRPITQVRCTTLRLASKEWGTTPGCHITWASHQPLMDWRFLWFFFGFDSSTRVATELNKSQFTRLPFVLDGHNSGTTRYKKWMEQVTRQRRFYTSWAHPFPNFPVVLIPRYSINTILHFNGATLKRHD